MSIEGYDIIAGPAQNSSSPGAPVPRGPLIILSGPSGCGKSTVIAGVLALGDLPLRLSVSAPTRQPRRWVQNGMACQEQDGVHYYFWSRERFEEEVRAGAFLEWAQVHGQCYGTLRWEVEPFRQRGIGVILDIDVQGAAQVRQTCPDSVSVFLRTSSWATYERRLRERGTEDEAAIQKRLQAAQGELARAKDYDVQVINDDLPTAVDHLHAIIKQQFERSSHAG